VLKNILTFLNKFIYFYDVIWRVFLNVSFIKKCFIVWIWNEVNLHCCVLILRILLSIIWISNFYFSVKGTLFFKINNFFYFSFYLFFQPQPQRYALLCLPDILLSVSSPSNVMSIITTSLSTHKLCRTTSC